MNLLYDGTKLGGKEGNVVATSGLHNNKTF